jgi:hypothetical protein
MSLSAPAPAPAPDWRCGLCLFECDICHVFITSSVAFWSHVNNPCDLGGHGLEVQGYKERFGDPCAKKVI